MNRFHLRGRTLALLVVIVPLLLIFIYVALRSGPLAPIAVQTINVQSQSIAPALFGIGTVEARYTHKIGAVFSGRIRSLEVDVGDVIKAGQILGEMDPVDLEDKLRAQEALIKRSQAMLLDAQARKDFAQTQESRYEALFKAKSTSEELLSTKRQELFIADAALEATQQELARVRAELDGLKAQQRNLRLESPVDGIVVVRSADPGTTVVAGQPVVEIIDPSSLWINARFDQIGAAGLVAGLPAQIVLRSRQEKGLSGKVLRVEPIADEITEEILAKISFDSIPDPLPPVGELAEVTVHVSGLPKTIVISNAAITHEGGKPSVWRIIDGALERTFVRLGASDLEGNVQVLEGLKRGDEVVVYSEKALAVNSRINVVDQIKAGMP